MQVALLLTTVAAHLVGEPRTGIASARLSGDVVGGREQPQPKGGCLVGRRADGNQRSSLVVGTHQLDRHRRELGQLLPESLRAGDHGMGTERVRHHRHGHTSSTQDESSDSRVMGSRPVRGRPGRRARVGSAA